MALFVVRHQHEPDRCPALDAEAGAELLNYLSRPNVKQHGITIKGEAVVQGEHTFFLIAEASDEAQLRRFMRPFSEAGSLDVFPASTCAMVVASGGCAADPPDVGDLAAVDPEEACQYALESNLVVHKAHPLNCETSIPALVGSVVMPNAHFYVRNHFQIPKLDPATFTVTIRGQVDRPLELSLADLRGMKSQTTVATLECAGNGRTLFDPPIPGEKWNLGAVSTAEWTGVPLAEILDQAGVRSDGREVVFLGADSGSVAGRKDPIAFGRSLTIDQARDEGVMLAYAMNGEPLPIQHGFPLRVIVPGWYAVASVKWLTDIEVVAEPYDGHYQAEKYWYEWEREEGIVREPVTLMQVRALITDPGPGQEVARGDVTFRGVAWSGAAPVARVEVSVDGGEWHQARLASERKRHSWQWWELQTRLDAPGLVSVRARAVDLAGRCQPDLSEWNKHGYGNNAIQVVTVKVN